MANVLHINSGIRQNGSTTRNISQSLVDQWKKENSAAVIVERDLASNPVPHLDELAVNAFYTPADQQSSEMQEATQKSDALVDELLNADVIVIGAPVYNFGIPSTLKSYFDQIARVGKTFQYGANGPEGLIKNKKVYVVTSRGSFRNPEQDGHETYLQGFLGFLGMTDVQFIHAEGVVDAEGTTKAMSKAEEQIQEFVNA
jgi:FMN-dependent NADH-azoreductase